MKYDIQKRIFLVKKYYEFQSFALVQRAYRSKYKNETTPSNNTILNMVSFKKNMISCVYDTLKQRSGEKEKSHRKLGEKFNFQTSKFINPQSSICSWSFSNAGF